MKKILAISSAVLATSTLLLIFIGGLVTSTHSGLAVPDWPLSYGQVMPPMVGGILFEHGHRLVAAGVGLFAIINAILFTIYEKRKWTKRLAWFAVFLVILQGVLGGLTVLFRLPSPISILHACLAQTFFCLTVALAVWSSNVWWAAPAPRTEPAKNVPLHQMGFLLIAVTFLQLIFGAVLRHSGHLLAFHIIGAFLVVFVAARFYFRVWQNHYLYTQLRMVSVLIMSGLMIQLVLGLFTFAILTAPIQALSRQIIQAAIISGHVMLGAAILGLSVTASLLAYRTRPPNSETIRKRLADILTLTKPGISFTAAITALAGFVMASHDGVDLGLLFHTGVGTCLVAAGAGVFNMLIEREADAKMKRTQKRPLPSGRMKPGEALLIGTLFAVSSIVYLCWAVNLLTGFLAGLTLSIYLYVYTPLKKISYLCTVVGAVAGALPPVMGWAAATGKIGPEPWILFGIIFFWQFPHFFSLAWLYRDDYLKGGFRMLPMTKSEVTPEGLPVTDTKSTAIQMVVNSAALLIISLLPGIFGWSGVVYLIVASALGLWMTIASLIFLSKQSIQSARSLFFASLIYVPVLVTVMVLNKIPS